MKTFEAKTFVKNFFQTSEVISFSFLQKNFNITINTWLKRNPMIKCYTKIDILSGWNFKNL